MTSRKSEQETKVRTSPLVRWEAPEFNFHSKSVFWSLGIGIIGFIGSAILIISREYFPAAIIVLAIIVIYQVGYFKPKKVHYAIDHGGLLLDDKFLSWKNYKNYFLIDIKGAIRVYLEPLKLLGVAESFIVPKEDTIAVLGVIAENLPRKKDGEEPWGDKILRWLKI